jgi:hypothetical protein
MQTITDCDFPLTADMRRKYLFLARPEQGKTACHAGKQFYFFEHHNLECDTNTKRWSFSSRSD